MQLNHIATALKLATRNAMSPGIWLSAVIGIPCIGAAVFAESWISIWLLTVMTVVVLGTFGIFLLHSIRNPNLLQSEDYLLRKDAMTIYGSSSYAGKEIVHIVDGGTRVLTDERGQENG